MTTDAEPRPITVDRNDLAEAIRASWTMATSADPERWSEANRARGQCDVTSLVLLEYLGGDLQLARVFLDGEQVEHHYWNQLTQDDALDLTREQFVEGQELSEPELVSGDMIHSKYETARSELRERHQLLRSAVSSRLGAEPEHPLNSSDRKLRRSEAG